MAFRPCGTHSKTISAPRHDAGAEFPTQSSFSLPSHLQNLTESPSANRELTEPQQAGKRLDGPNYQSVWPNVANWRMPQCRAAGPQCDQKVNKELGCILWKAVYRNDNRCRNRDRPGPTYSPSPPWYPPHSGVGYKGIQPCCRNLKDVECPKYTAKTSFGGLRNRGSSRATIVCRLPAGSA